MASDGKKRKRDNTPNGKESAGAKKRQKNDTGGQSKGADKKAAPNPGKKSNNAQPKRAVPKPRDPEDMDLAYLEGKLGLSSESAKKHLESELKEDGLGGKVGALVTHDHFTDHSRLCTELLVGLSDLDSDDEEELRTFGDGNGSKESGESDEEEDNESEYDEHGEEGSEEGSEEGEEEPTTSEVIDEEIEELEAKIKALRKRKNEQRTEIEASTGATEEAKKEASTTPSVSELKAVAGISVFPSLPRVFSLIPSTGKYVPPSMRQSTADERLSRQVRGLLNRLAPSNLHSIGMKLLTIYNDNSSNRTLNQTLIRLSHTLLQILWSY